MKKQNIEHQLLFSCACFTSEKADFQKFDLAKINWSYFLFLAERHRVVPMVFHNLTKWGINLTINNQLKKRTQQLSAQNLYQCALLLEIDKSFKKHGVACIHFKGPALSQFLFSNPNLRQCKDIDILIQKQNAEKAFEVLKEQQFTLNNARFNKSYLNKRYQNWYKDYSFVKQQAELELHWSFGDYYPSEVSDILFNELYKMRFKNEEIATLSAEDYLVYLILHGYYSGFARLHWLCDIKDLLSLKKIDLRCVEEKLAKLNNHHLLAEVLQLCEIVFVKQPFKQKISHTNILCLKIMSTDKIDQKKSISNFTYRYLIKKIQIQLMKCKKQKYKFYKKYIFTSYADWKIIEFPEKLFFMYYLCKPIFFVLRELVIPSTSKILARRSQIK